MKSANSTGSLVFDYRTIRLMIGLIALLLPWLVSLRALLIPDSISGSYYTASRDVFVGALFVVGAFLISYKGRGPWEDAAGWTGGVAAWVTALFPTSPSAGDEASDWVAIVHLCGAILVFATTVYFCWFAFGKRAKEKSEADSIGKGAQRRLFLYRISGAGISVVLLLLLFLKLARLEPATGCFTFVMETIALTLFGLAWLVASHYIPGLGDSSPGQAQAA